MDNFENNLREALREPRPPAELTEKVMARLSKSLKATVRRRSMYPFVIAAASVAVLAIAVPMVFHKRSPAARPAALAETETGSTIKAGEIFRSNGGVLLTLSDGSRVEMRGQSELSLDRAGDGLRIRLDKGGIVVTAAKQRTGHLYVRTKDAVVSVAGTVFLVNAEEQGSRIAVIEGEVRVEQGAIAKKVRPGEQVATNPLMQPLSVSEEISWSRNVEEHLALLAQNTPAPRVAFEVASVKARPPAAAGGRGGPPGDEPKCYGSVKVDPGHMLLTNMMLYRIITLAYGKSCYGFEKMDLLSGGPRWVRSDRFDIDAVIPAGSPGYTERQFDPDSRQSGESVDAPQLQLMLQTLLAERFNLVLRRDSRDTPGYALTVARGGAKLKAWKEGELVTLGGVIDAPNQNGEFRTIVRGNKLSVAQLANQLVQVTGRPVVDKTGIAGDFNYSIEFAPFNTPDSGVLRDRPIMSSPSLFTALEEELGLKLEAARVPLEFLVIERADKPSEN